MLLTDHPNQAEQLRAYGLLAVVRLRQGKAEAGRQDAGGAGGLAGKSGRAQRLGMPLEAALAHSELGRHLAGTPQGRWHLEQAQTLLHELGIADVAGWGRCAG